MTVFFDERDIDNLVFEPPELGTVLYLPGLPGGGNSIYDRSPYGNLGTITGATWVRLSSGLPVLSYDGTDDYTNCGAGASLKIVDYITVEMWLKPTSGVGTDTQYFFSVHKEDTNTNSIRVLTDRKVRAYRNIATVQSYEDSTTLVVNDVWTHFAYTGSTGTFKMYLNGADALATQVAGTHIVNLNIDANLWLGGNNSGVANRFKGSIALAKVYNYARSAIQIQNDFNQERTLFGV